MADLLVIRLTEGPDDSVEWIEPGSAEAGPTKPKTGDLDEIAQLSHIRKTILLVPASKVLRTTANIPLKGDARIRQALPFALEENLATDIDQQHFAFGKKDTNGNLPVAVVDREQMSAWLAPLKDKLITPAAVYAESDALEAVPATLSVFLENGNVLIQPPSGELTVADESSMATLIKFFLDTQAEEMENDATAIPVSLVVYCDNDAYERNSTLWERLRLEVEYLDVKILADGALPFLATQINERHGVNLLQGNFAPKTELPFHWEQWKIAAVLLVTFLALNLLHKGIEYWQLSNADAALDEGAAALLAETFPGSAGSADPWRELRNRLGDADAPAVSQSSGFAEALETVSSAFANTPGIQLETVSFRSGVLDIQLIAPDVAALDQLRQKISDPGLFTAEIQSANPSEEIIKGRIQIKAVEAT